MSMKEEFTAIDMATAAADGFRAGQRAAQSAGVPDALREAVEYLDDNSFNEIGAGSILHRAMRDALAAAPTVKAEQASDCTKPGCFPYCDCGGIDDEAPSLPADGLAEWIEHGPSKACPFSSPYTSKVDVRLRDGTERLGDLACNTMWFWYEHDPKPYDVVAYRIAALSAQQSAQPEFCCKHSYKVAKQAAWDARDLTHCKCDHNEYCEHCWPDDFKEGGKWYNGFEAQQSAPERVSVSRDLLADLISSDHDTKIQAERALYALLASHGRGEA